MSKADTRQVFCKDLIAGVGQSSVLTSDTDVWAYGQDNSRKHVKPSAVVLAENPSQVKTTVRLCYQHGIPLTVRGRGTGTAGGAIPSSNGIVLSLERMDKVLRVDPANRFAQVEAGVLNQTVQDAVAVSGFFWPPDPTSAAFCTVEAMSPSTPQARVR